MLPIVTDSGTGDSGNETADAIEITLPFEFIVQGTPLSLQASASSLAAWRERVRAAAGTRLQGHEWLVQDRVRVRIIQFLDAPPVGDLDNIVKPILDALESVVFTNDILVDQLDIRRIAPGDTLTVARSSPTLLEALGGAKPSVYIAVDGMGTKEDWR